MNKSYHIAIDQSDEHFLGKRFLPGNPFYTPWVEKDRFGETALSMSMRQDLNR